LRTHFPDVPHADRSGFRFITKLDETKPEYHFDLYIDIAGEQIRFAGIHLLNRLASEINPADINQNNQINFLRPWATRKDREAIDYVAILCAKVISICGEQTSPAVFGILGDALEAKNS
jgi:hypothetical protein